MPTPLPAEPGAVHSDELIAKQDYGDTRKQERVHSLGSTMNDITLTGPSIQAKAGASELDFRISGRPKRGQVKAEIRFMNRGRTLSTKVNP